MSRNQSMNKGFSENASGKVKVIDQTTYEHFLQEPKTRKIKNVKYKKSRNTLNLSQFIKPKLAPKGKTKRIVYAIYKKETKHIKKRKRRFSPLKKCILKYRSLKRNANINEDKPDILIKSQTEDVTKCFNDLTLQGKSKSGLHSRRFREYCDNTTSQELCHLVQTLLKDLYRFQKRAFLSNQYKGRCRRRIVIGFREVQTHMKINKVKCIVIATDCEICDLPGGLDQTIMNLKEECKNKNIPYVFALQRRQISYVVFKKSPISCVGILDYDGAQDIFFKMLSVLEQEKFNYKCLTQQIKTAE